MLVAAVSALVAAALFATASALQHRSAGLVAGASPGGRVPDFVLASARHPYWLVGSAAELAGFGLHAFALHAGPLTLVQPLLVSGVVFALPLRQLVERRRPRPGEMAWAALLAAGLAAFLLAATPGPDPPQPPDLGPTVAALVLVPLGMAVSVLVARHLRGERAAAVLGVGAGLGFAAVAGLLKAVDDQLAHSLERALASWPLYLLVVAGVAALVLNQLAYRAAPLRASLAAINTVDPVASIVIGVAVFDERFRHSLPAVGVEVLGLLVVVVAVVSLTRAPVRRSAAGAAHEQPSAR